jgi:hypothetical protein
MLCNIEAGLEPAGWGMERNTRPDSAYPHRGGTVFGVPTDPTFAAQVFSAAEFGGVFCHGPVRFPGMGVGIVRLGCQSAEVASDSAFANLGRRLAEIVARGAPRELAGLLLLFESDGSPCVSALLRHAGEMLGEPITITGFARMGQPGAVQTTVGTGPWDYGEHPFRDLRVSGFDMRMAAAREADRRFEATVPTGTSCPECGTDQSTSPSGVTCVNGHGGLELGPPVAGHV